MGCILSDEAEVGGDEGPFGIIYIAGVRLESTHVRMYLNINQLVHNTL